MLVHLVDGTYELFRHFYGGPGGPGDDDLGAVRGVVRSMLGMLEDGATHLGVATDHVIESFRNDLYPGYKTGEGIDPVLWAQFWPLEDALRALGVTVWAMVEFEADDALASAAAVATADPRVGQVVIYTPDKDLGQCVSGERVVQVDRRSGSVRTAEGVVERFGVPPASIPDLLALTGDSADGFPGVARWGAKSAATLLARYGTIESIPADPATWDVTVRGAASLSASLEASRAEAMLYREIATLRTDAPVGTVDDWEWTGPGVDLGTWAERLRAPDLIDRVAALTPPEA